MNPSGDFNPANYSASNPYSADTGTNWAYIRIINNSPYLLLVTLAGQGSKKIVENFIEDIQVTSAYNGKVIITPQANFPVQAISAALSSMTSIECYLAGEVPAPIAQPITTLASVGNSVIQANEIVNTGSGILTPIINANELPGGNQRFIAAMNNDGSMQLGEALPVVLQVSCDNQGNLSSVSLSTGAISGTAPVKLRTGSQETGYCGASFEVGGSVASAIGPTVNFKTVMTNVPSSITLNTPIENSGASSPAAADINIYGFWLTWTATTINSLSRYTNTYTTVNN